MKDVKRSARLKDKKVHYADMVNGTHIFDLNGGELKLPSPEKQQDVLIVPKPRDSIKRNLNNIVIENSKDCEDSEMSSDHENRDICVRPTYPEEAEIHKLKAKSHRKRLTKREARRLKRLKEKVQKKEMLRKLKEKRKAKFIEKQQKLGQKSKRKLQETHAYTKKVNPEHCYAACPENFNKQKAAQSPVQVKTEIKTEIKTEVKTEPETEIKTEIKVEEVTVKEEPPCGVPEEAVVHDSVEELTVGDKSEGEPIKCEQLPQECRVELEKSEPLELLHRDSLHRNGQRGWLQDGDLFLHLYQAEDSPCIQCKTCNEFYSIKRFLKHMHRHNSPDELLEVELPQKMEMRQINPTDVQQALWDEYEKRLNKIQEHAQHSQRKGEEESQKKPQESPDKDVSKPKSSMVKAVNMEITLRNQEAATTQPSAISVGTASTTRHSTRVRKRKLLHPMERYVYSKTLANTEPAEKKHKFDPEIEFSETRLKELDSKLLPSEISSNIDKMSVSVSPVRAMKVKLNVRKDGDDKQVITKYDLKVNSPQIVENGKRSARVITKRMRNVDCRLTALEQDDS